ncbi:MAG: 50S ribosomal protein L23 [Alphaproteobacteria bacterium]
MSKLPATERDLQIFLRPLVTEKTTRMAEQGNWVSFEVLKGTTKTEIKQAFTRVFGVEPERVNTLITKGKARGQGRLSGHRSDVKKAFIKLKDGQSIDMATGA